MNTCYIICAGDADKIEIRKEKGDLIIAADNGLSHCRRNGIVPDLLVGDFDSLGYVPDGQNVLTLPVAKDDTDTSFAVKYAMEKGYRRFILFGAAGGKRPEHTYANMALLAFISKNGAQGFMDCGSYTITAITDSEIRFLDKLQEDVSVFSFDNRSEGVTEEGLLYSLTDAVMKNTMVTGISNSFTGQESRISVKKGTLLVYYAGKPSDAVVLNNTEAEK